MEQEEFSFKPTRLYDLEEKWEQMRGDQEEDRE